MTASDKKAENGFDSSPRANGFSIHAESLGSPAFRQTYGIRYAHAAGAMYKSIASKELVISMAKAGLLGFLGTGGMKYEEVEAAIQAIQQALPHQQNYGVNLLNNLFQADYESHMVDLYLKYGIRTIEAAAYLDVSSELIRFRLLGLKQNETGNIICTHNIIAKVSRPEVAAVFMRPPSESIVQKLLKLNKISAQQAQWGKLFPVATDICIESDSGGHTDQGVALALLPAMQRLRQDVQQEHQYAEPLRLGAAGGIGTPEAAAAMFMMGADFIVTGSINQCTVEAGTSDAVKELLQDINIQDTEYAPAGDMFEFGAKVQVLKKGMFFPARANKLYALYQQYDSLDALDEKTKNQLQTKYFKRTFDEIWNETRTYYLSKYPEVIHKAEQSPKHKMALIFKWYFIHSSRLALSGSATQKTDYQVHTGPALGAFNQWVKGTQREHWRNRYVAEINEYLMQSTAALLTQRFASFIQAERSPNAK
ncbi:MAG: PfaD family polyunsaturated fatty acid/polyketide biosynthesis protein [Pseudomonadota bacterium]